MVFFGNGDGTFAAGPQNTTICADEALAVGDLNDDGKLDVVGACGTGTIQIAYGNADGTSQAGPVISGAGAYSITVADVTGDGLPDILANSVGLLVFVNQGGGALGLFTRFLPGDNVYASAVGDLNGDGFVDIVAGTGNGARVLLGTVGGGFGNGQAITLQQTAGSLALADMNGDGKLDLVATAGASAIRSIVD